MLRPNLPEPGIVLGLVEAWPSGLTIVARAGSTASLDKPLRATPVASWQVGAGESLPIEQGKWDNE